jgi:hypothetical protein
VQTTISVAADHGGVARVRRGGRHSEEVEVHADIEAVWRDLKRYHLAHRTFTGPEDLDCAIHDAVAALHAERSRHPLRSQRSAA